MARYVNQYGEHEGHMGFRPPRGSTTERRYNMYRIADTAERLLRRYKGLPKCKIYSDDYALAAEQIAYRAVGGKGLSWGNQQHAEMQEQIRKSDHSRDVTVYPVWTECNSLTPGVVLRIQGHKVLMPGDAVYTGLEWRMKAVA